jgi:predicted SprT family Zn-dependent metalloprotease
MVRPNASQSARLELLRGDVVEEMKDLGIFPLESLTIASTVTLGLLRKSSTQRHGVTRWTRKQGALVLETVDLHPVLLEQHWSRYAAFVLYHELLHAIGNRSHDRDFRAMESLWPDIDASKQGSEFTNKMRLERASWLWVCVQCDMEYPRQRPSGGKYQCRKCRCRLVDRPIKDMKS